MTNKLRAREFWIYKGRSNFCSELVMADDYETLVQQTPEGFYDVVSTSNTIKGGIHVIEHSAYLAIQQELDEARQQLEFYCGNKCDSHYNPCSAREYLAKYPRGKG